GTGSGVAAYTIYVSDNNGTFAPWLANTKLTTAQFVGVGGHTYRFYSVATDNVGNVQPTPSSAQAATTVPTSGQGPRVVAVTPAGPVSTAGLSSVTLTFGGPVNPATVSLADIAGFTGPNGAIAATAITDATPVIPGVTSPHNVYTL